MALFRHRAVRITGVVVAMLIALICWVLISEMYTRQQVPTALAFKFVHTDLWEEGYATASGTWATEDRIGGTGGLYDPLNTSSVECRARLGTCFVARSSIAAGTTPLLDMKTDLYDIKTWTKDSIVFGEEAKCVEYIYTFDRATKQVSGMRRLKADIPEGNCGAIKEKEVPFRLVNGFDVYWKATQAARPVAMNIAVLITLLAAGALRIRRIWKEGRVPPAAQDSAARAA